MAQQQWLTAKARQILQRNSVSWQTSCMQQHQLERCPRSLTRKLFKANWTATYLTWLRHWKCNWVLVWANLQTHWPTRTWPSVSASITGIRGQNFLSLRSDDCRVKKLDGNTPFRCLHFYTGNSKRDCLSDNNRQLWSCVMTRWTDWLEVSNCELKLEIICLKELKLKLGIIW